MCRICLVVGNGNRLRGFHHPVDVRLRDFLLLDRDHAVRRVALDVAARDAGVDRLDLAVGHQFGFLEHALDRRHRRLDVDHHAFLQSARRLRAHADHVELALRRDLGDDRDDLRRADVEAHHQVLAVLHHALFLGLSYAAGLTAFSRNCGTRAANPFRYRRSTYSTRVPALRQRPQRPRLRRDEAREARIRVVAAEFDRKRSVRADRVDVPASARGKAQRAHRERERRQAPGPRVVLRRHLRGPAFLTLELGQVVLPFGVEHLAAGIHQRGVVPARERRVLVHFDLEAMRPLPAQGHVAHPRDLRQGPLRAVQVHREERSGQFLAHDRLQVSGTGALQRLDHDDFAQRKRRLANDPGNAAPQHRHRHENAQRRGDRVHLLRVIPHGRLPVFPRTVPGRTFRTASPPSVPGCARSSRATCSLPGMKTCRRRAG